MTTSVFFTLRLENGKDILSKFKRFVECFDNYDISTLSIDGNEIFNYILEKRTASTDDVTLQLSKYKNWNKTLIMGSFITNSLESLRVNKNTLLPNNQKSKLQSSLSWSSNYSYFIQDAKAGLPGHTALVKQDVLVKRLYKVLDKIIHEIDPLVIWLLPDTASDLIASWFEYYKDPYFFCIEPDNYEGLGTQEVACEFLYNEGIKQELDRIREVIPREELIRLIKENSDETIAGENGLGVIRKEYEKRETGYEGYVRPRFFLRKELRARGYQLELGLSEKTITKGIVSRPDIMRKLGIIDEGIYNRIEEATNMLSEKERSLENFESMVKKVIEKTLSKNELKELGLV